MDARLKDLIETASPVEDRVRSPQDVYSAGFFSAPRSTVTLSREELDGKESEYEAVAVQPAAQSQILVEIIAQLKASFTQDLDPKTFEIYVKPLGGRFLNDKESSDAVTMLEKFIDDPVQRSLLVLADSGGGKTVLGQYLASQLWKQHQPDKPIPLFIHLPTIPEDKCKGELLDYFLTGQGLTLQQIHLLLRSETLIVILDGYDEVRDPGNLYLQNHWGRYKKIKLVTTCRHEALQRQANINNREWFYPDGTPSHKPTERFSEVVLKLFTVEQIHQYLADYVKQHPIPTQGEFKGEDWDAAETYQKHIKAIPGLYDLATNPFILSMIAKALPRIVADYQAKAAHERLQLTRTKLYDFFVEYWFSYQRTRLLAQKNSPLAKLSGSIESYLRIYSQNLAYQVLRAERLDIIFTEAMTLQSDLMCPRDEKDLAAYSKDQSLFTEEVIVQIRSACLLKTAAGGFIFMHKSLVEYFAAYEIFTGIIASVHFLSSNKSKEMAERNLVFNEQPLTQERGILLVLADLAKEDKLFKDSLFEIIRYSRINPASKIAAANAITILVLAKVNLSGQNFRGVQIPNADLTGALAHKVDFTGANLKGVCFRDAYLGDVKFTNSQMVGVRFGELPFIGGNFTTLCFSGDGKWLATGDYRTGIIELWDTVNWKYRQHLVNPGYKKGLLMSLSFGPDHRTLAVAADRWWLWDIETGECIHTIKTANSCAISIAKNLIFSTDGKKVYHWKRDRQAMVCTKSIVCNFSIFSINSDEGFYLARSKDSVIPKDGCFAGCNTLHLYHLITGALIKTVVYQESIDVPTVSNGHWMAIGDPNRRSVVLYDIKNGEQDNILSGGYCHITFSDDERYVAAANESKTILIWDTRTRECVRTIETERNYFTHFAFNPDATLLICIKRMEKVDYYPKDFFSAIFGNPLELLWGSQGDHPERLYFFEMQAQFQTKKFEQSVHGSIRNIYPIFHRDLIVSWSYSGKLSGKLQLWNVQTGQYQDELEQDSKGASRVAISPDVKLMAFELNDHLLTIKEIDSGKTIQINSRHESNASCLVFNFYSTLLAIGRRDGSIQLWRTDAKDIALRAWHRLEGHGQYVQTLAFSHNNDWLASSDYPILSDSIFSRRSTVRVWNIKTAMQYAYLKQGLNAYLPALGFDTKDALLVIAEGSNIYLWDIKTKVYLKTLTGHTQSISRLAFVPQSDWLASGDDGGYIRLQNLKQSKEAKSIVIHGHSSVETIAADKDGKYLFSGGDDSSIKCWKLFSEKGDMDPQLEWINSGYQALFCQGADITGVLGLSTRNMALLKQKGATGEPGGPLPLLAPSPSSSSASSVALSPHALLPGPSSSTVTNLFVRADQVNIVSAGRDIVATNSTIATNRK